ncbi:hypothetical protein F3J24_04640 [Comamonas sp. Tr-654]|uniref:hypothetical protein n=1 Tax=Comamonas sp. Tr-654 TaxID=2608341 RepID=UPI00142113A9|nr:hypothetical protein [Comamonas sp. Tr-654]NIF82795.1 hypothetical protein [Comamonas sp. Tr-654]
MQKNNQDEGLGFRGVNWRQAPVLARWWAINPDGRAYWFFEPTYDELGDIWFPEMELAPTFGYAGDHKASLTPRPV